MIDKIDSDFLIIKQTLNTLPKNNESNISKCLKFTDEAIEKYSNDFNEIKKEIKKRYEVLNNFSCNNEIPVVKEQIKKYNSLKILNSYKTSYSMMGFDKLLYNLDHFYKDNLDIVNENILKCLKCFDEVGIKKYDINYSSYAKEYVNILRNNQVNIHQKFEDIYWKCPDVIMHISNNIKSIFLQNEKLIDKYLKNKLLSYLNGKTKEEVIKEYYSSVIYLENLIDNDKKIFVDKFFNNELSVKSFKNISIEELYSSLSDNVNDNISENIKKLSYSLQEYKSYLKNEFVFEDIKKMYLEKEKYKNQYISKYKEIVSLEKKLKKTNGRNILKMVKKIDLLKINNIILELDKKYKELDELRFRETIMSFTDDKTIYDVVSLALSDYNYLVSLAKKNNIEVDELINDLENIILYPHLTVINNIAIIEEKEIPYLISDRYMLSSLKVEPDKLNSVADIDSLIENCSRIFNMEKLIKFNLNVEDIEFMLEAKKILG